MMREIGLTAVVLLAGCGVVPGLSCTLIGCTSNLDLTVTDPAPLDRDIDVTVDVGGQVLECSGPVDPVNGLGCAGIAISPSEGGYVVSVVPDAEEPVAVRLTIAFDGEVVFDDDVTVSWGEPDSPNGPGCEPTCIQGDAEVAI